MSAVSRLARSLGVERGEGRVFAWAATTLFLIGWAAVSLTNVSETFFLKRVGVNRLPAVFLVNALLLVGTTYGIGRIATRTARRRLLVTTFAALGGIAMLLWLLVLAQAPGVFVLLVIASKQLDAIALIVFWTLLGGLLDGRQAKRLYPPMIAGGTLGRILGSFASGTIGAALGIAALLPVAALALALAGALAARARSAAPAHPTRMTGKRAAALAPSALRKFGPLWRESRLFQLLALSALFAGTVGPMLYFQFSDIVDLATRGSNGELRLLNLYATLRGVMNAGVLGMQLLGTARVFRRIGVPLASVLSPLVYFAGFVGVSARFDLRSGVGAVVGTTLQDHAIQDPAQRVLATLLPERMRAAATSLIEGPVQRTGSVLGNLLVLSTLAVSTPAWIGFAALPIAGLWLLTAIALWRIYPTLLLEVAAAGPMQTDITQSLPELMDPGTVQALTAALVDADPQRCRAACALVIEAPRARAVVTLARAIGNAPAANRPLLIEALHDVIERHPDTQQPVPEAADRLEPWLSGASALPLVERGHLIDAYARLVPALQPGTPGARVLTQLLSDPVPAIRLVALVHLRTTGLAEAGEDLDAICAGILAGGDAAARHLALEALRSVLLAPAGASSSDGAEAARWEARLVVISERLEDAQDRARTAEVLADIAARHGGRLAAMADRLLPYAQDRDPRVRTAILRFIGPAGLAQHVEWVIERLAADEESEAAAAAATLRSFGTAAVNALLNALHGGRRAVREAVVPILRDLPITVTELHTLIDHEVRSIGRILLEMHGLRTGPVSDVVLQRLNERIGESLYATLLLFATLLHEDRIASLGRVLVRSSDARQRAVLLEALETLLPPAASAQLIPLFEDVTSATLATAAARALGRHLPSFDEAVREALADDDALTRTLLAATLDAQTRRRHISASAGSDGLAAEAELEHDGDREGATLNKVEIMLHLRGLELFARLTTRDLSELSDVAHEETCRPGTVIVREGEFGDCMYLVVEGEARVTCAGEFIAGFKPGEFFGEMSLFDGETRSATVTAVTRMRLLRLQRNDLLQLMDEEPAIAIAMCQTLSGRVRDLINRLEGRGAKDTDEA